MLKDSTDFFWQASFWTGVCAFIITSLVLLALLFFKLKRQLKLRRDRTFFDEWHPLLIRTALDETALLSFPALKSGDDWRLLKLWVHLQMLLRGDASENLCKFAHELNLQSFALFFLKSPNKSEQILGLVALGYLHDETSWNLLTPLLEEPSNSTALYAAWALLKISPPRAAELVLQALMQHPTSSIVQTAALFKPFRVDLTQPWLVKFEKLCATYPASQAFESQIAWLLKIAHSINLEIPVALLIPLLQDASQIDITIGALKLIKHTDGLHAVRRLASHPDWEIRAQVAIALGRLGDDSDIERLKILTTDTQWWVRYRAAHALVYFPGIDKQALIESVSHWSDRYAKDMVWQVLAETPVAYAE